MKVSCLNCGNVLMVPDATLRVGNPTLRCTKCKATFKAKPDTGPKKVKDKAPTEEYKLKQEEKYMGEEPGWLVVHDEYTAPQSFPLKEGKQLVGRKSASKPCDVMVETKDMYMSRNHFYVEVIKNKLGAFEYILYNDAPVNPTFLRQQDVKNNKHYLQDGDVIQAGATKIIFKTTQKARTEKDAADQVKKEKYPPTVRFQKR